MDMKQTGLEREAGKEYKATPLAPPVDIIEDDANIAPITRQGHQDEAHASGVRQARGPESAEDNRVKGRNTIDRRRKMREQIDRVVVGCVDIAPTMGMKDTERGKVVGRGEFPFDNEHYNFPFLSCCRSRSTYSSLNAPFV